MTEPALSLRSIIKTFGSLRAVDDVSLDIADGEFVTLLGSSGSGKSTLLAIIAGFEDPTSGAVTIGGNNVVGVPAHKRGVGMVFQNYALFPHLTVLDNIAFGLRTLRWSELDIRSRTDELLQIAHLTAMAGRYPAELSGGQQQRVALVRALAARPRLLLLDEPLGALDKSLREHMMAEFRSIHRALGTTMVYVTHDQQEALAMSDRIAVMHDGKLLRVATPAELYNDPRTTFVAGFIGESNIITARRAGSGLFGAGAGLRIPAPADAEGVTASLAVRPESIVIGSPPEGWASGTGTVTEVIFLGDCLKYRIACGETLLTVQMQNTRGVPVLAEGSTVSLGWHPNDTRYLSS